MTECSGAEEKEGEGQRLQRETAASSPQCPLCYWLPHEGTKLKRNDIKRGTRGTLGDEKPGKGG